MRIKKYCLLNANGVVVDEVPVHRYPRPSLMTPDFNYSFVINVRVNVKDEIIQ